MISLELAERLKELGLKFNDLTARPYYCVGGRLCEPMKPTLSQLLEEVEKRRYGFKLLYEHTKGDYKYQFDFFGMLCIGEDEEGNQTRSQFRGKHIYAPTPEDAVALALIAIMEGEK